MNIDETLSNIFNAEPIPEAVVKTTPELTPTTVIDNSTGNIVEANVDKIQSDYDKTRNNLHDLLETGMEALESALLIAKESEHPRAFEVVGNLMKQIADMNQQLMDIHQQKAKLDNATGLDSSKTGTGNTTNNAIFVGSTSELSRLIKTLK